MRGAALVRARAVLAAAGAAGLLAGCSTATSSPVTVSGKTLTIYASQEPAGAGGQAATDVLDAEELAFKQSSHTIGKFTLKFSVAAGRELTANGRTAVSDTTAIAYLGETEPGTSQLTVPITNEVGLLEISPTDTAVYLTQASSVVGDSPGTFYPSSSTYHQTFARLVPNSAEEAKALVAAMHARGATKLWIADDGTDYGASIAAEVRQDASGAGLTVASSAADADAIFYGAEPTAAATRQLDALAAATPSAKLFTGSALYDDTFAAGLSAAAQARLYVTSPGFMPSALTAAAKQFDSAFAAAYGHQPAPEAIFGAEAVDALIAVLQQAGTHAGQRSTVVSDFRTLHDRQSSLIGTYSIAGGDTSIAPFILARPKAGALVPVATAAAS